MGDVVTTARGAIVGDSRGGTIEGPIYHGPIAWFSGCRGISTINDSGNISTVRGFSLGRFVAAVEVNDGGDVRELGGVEGVGIHRDFLDVAILPLFYKLGLTILEQWQRQLREG